MPTVLRANTLHRRRARFLSSYLRQSRPRTRAKHFQADSETAKPSPEIYLTVISRLALQPSQCLVVENSLTGVLSAKHAGCRVSALTRTFAAHELLGVGADFIFEDFQSLKGAAEIEKYFPFG